MSSLERCADALLQQKAVQASAHERAEEQLRLLQQNTRSLSFQLQEVISDVQRREKDLEELVDGETRAQQQLRHCKLRCTAVFSFLAQHIRQDNAQQDELRRLAQMFSGFPATLCSELSAVEGLCVAKELMKHLREALHGSNAVALCLSVQHAFRKVLCYAANTHEHFLNIKDDVLDREVAQLRSAQQELGEQRKHLGSIQAEAREAVMELQRSEGALLGICEHEELILALLTERRESVFLPMREHMTAFVATSQQHRMELLRMKHETVTQRKQQLKKQAELAEEARGDVAQQRAAHDLAWSRERELLSEQIDAETRRLGACEAQLEVADLLKARLERRLESLVVVTACAAALLGLHAQRQQRLEEQLAQMEARRDHEKVLAHQIGIMQRRNQRDREAREALTDEETLTREGVGDEELTKRLALQSHEAQQYRDVTAREAQTRANVATCRAKGRVESAVGEPQEGAVAPAIPSKCPDRAPAPASYCPSSRGGSRGSRYRLPSIAQTRSGRSGHVDAESSTFSRDRLAARRALRRQDPVEGAASSSPAVASDGDEGGAATTSQPEEAPSAGGSGARGRCHSPLRTSLLSRNVAPWGPVPHAGSLAGSPDTEWSLFREVEAVAVGRGRHAAGAAPASLQGAVKTGARVAEAPWASPSPLAGRPPNQMPATPRSRTAPRPRPQRPDGTMRWAEKAAHPRAPPPARVSSPATTRTVPGATTQKRKYHQPGSGTPLAASPSRTTVAAAAAGSLALAQEGGRHLGLSSPSPLPRNPLGVPGAFHAGAGIRQEALPTGGNSLLPSAAASSASAWQGSKRPLGATGPSDRAVGPRRKLVVTATRPAASLPERSAKTTGMAKRPTAVKRKRPVDGDDVFADIFSAF